MMIMMLMMMMRRRRRRRGANEGVKRSYHCKRLIFALFHYGYLNSEIKVKEARETKAEWLIGKLLHG